MNDDEGITTGVMTTEQDARRLLLWRLLGGVALSAPLIAAATEEAEAANILFENTLFLSGAPGATTKRTPAQRAADIFNVKDFGATGDGSTPDQAAIQAAITSASNNGIIFFPKGTYKVTSAILIPVGSSLILTGVGDGSHIVGNFNGFIFDNLSNPSNEQHAISIIENLNIENSYTGNNFPITANGTWSSSGSPVNITLSGTNPGVAAGGALFINDGVHSSTNSVFVGMITSVASWPTVTVSSAAVGSGATSNMTLHVVQCYAAASSWGTISSGTYVSGTGVISLTMGSTVTTTILAGDALPIFNLTGAGTNLSALNGTWTVLSSSGTAITVQGPAGQGAITIAGGTYSALRINMGTTPPAGISGQYYLYNYEDILADPKTNFNRGVVTWSGTLLPTTPGSYVVGSSVGASDRLWLAPVAGAVRYSSVVVATVRDCTISGFLGVTSSQDKILDNIGVAQGFNIAVERCKFGNPSGCAAVTGQTGIYLTNNSIAYYNDFNTMWCSVRLSGTACSVIGGRMEVGYFGIIVHGDTTGSINSSAETIIAALSMESNLLGLYVESGGNININAVGASCFAVNPIGGFYFNSISGVVQNSGAVGNFGTGYAIFVADPNNVRQNCVFEACSAVNNSTPLQSWRLPTQSWWGTCTQCDNPALVYTFAKLTGVSTNPAAVEGDEYNISDGTDALTWGQTATNTGSHTTHYKVRYNGTNWTVMGK